MTEKHYGGSAGFGFKGIQSDSKSQHAQQVSRQKEKKQSVEKSETLDEYESYIKAGKLTSEAVKYARSIVKKGVPLIELAEKIEAKIKELGGKPAFPVNLSINEIAAHYSPAYDDKTTASGLMKVDIGVHIDGFAADTAFSIDLENSDTNKRLIESAESALKEGLKVVKESKNIGEIGKAISTSIQSNGFEPIRNLSGHSIEEGQLHAGITIPNYDSGQDIELDSGVYAIEPFVTNGAGLVRDGKPSGIYEVQKEGSVRDSFAREVLTFILEEYGTLPFCSRWIYKQFGSRGLLALRNIESAGLLHHYTQLVEKAGGIVAQAEHTIIISDKGIEIITL